MSVIELDRRDSAIGDFLTIVERHSGDAAIGDARDLVGLRIVGEFERIGSAAARDRVVANRADLEKIVAAAAVERIRAARSGDERVIATAALQ